MGWLSAIGSLLKIVGVILGLVQQSREQQTGVDLQAGADAEKVAKTETAIAEAEANAPKDQAGLVSSLQSGSF